MWNLLESISASAALFLTAQFFHGMLLRTLREKKPHLFERSSWNQLILYGVGIYYGLLGAYFIYRAQHGLEYGIYTDMLLNIILIFNLLSTTKKPASIAVALIIFFKFLLAPHFFDQLVYVAFILAYHLICMEISYLKVNFWKKFVFAKLSMIPFMLLYLHQKVPLAYDVTALPDWVSFFAVSFFVSFILFQAILYVDSSNKMAYELKQSALRDPLTNLANYRHFETLFTDYFLHAKHRSTPLGLIIFDIDYFKQVNDTYGHQAGNTILNLLSVSLKNLSLPKGTVAARIGGEEFAILVPQATLMETYQLAERIRQMVTETPFPFLSEQTGLTVSCGVASFDQTGGTHFDTKAQLFEAADRALYIAKERGRNQVFALFNQTDQVENSTISP
ncbi:GGDEF domain-containing protein [Listeria costaricensis]|uniref:GGDEF domain-containing protein n=1 Tax=Listeria costaricensis TaxID=2026604 RepID=UPI000C077E37|nr:GGDEF domain-containing protein [Listeria costaricensis]